MTGDAWDEAQAEIVRLRAEVAALRRDLSLEIGHHENTKSELAEARALLARVFGDPLRGARTPFHIGRHDDCWHCSRQDEAWAILRGDEGSQIENIAARDEAVTSTYHEQANGTGGRTSMVTTISARDEARCPCGDYALSGMHWSNCPARDEATCTCGGGRYVPIGLDHAPDCPARLTEDENNRGSKP